MIGPDGDKPVDGVAQFCAGAVQEDAAMTGREAEDGGDLVGVAAFEVAQDDDGALRRRKGLEGLRDVPPELPPRCAPGVSQSAIGSAQWPSATKRSGS